MINDNLWHDIRQRCSDSLNAPLELHGVAPVAGGDINDAYCLSTSLGNFFVKVARENLADIFRAEQQGLLCLASYKSLRCPVPICLGEHQNRPYLVMEHLSLGTSRDDACLGTRLAQLHKLSASRSAAPGQPPAKTPFGLTHNNYIGLTPQHNSPESEWCRFWLDRRLLPQLHLACKQGFDELKRCENRLIVTTEALLVAHKPSASALHGDLWSGNWGVDESGEAVIFDPAVYFGDREADLAMTHVFGGFSRRFYHAYQHEWPLPDNWRHRLGLYKLYHLLNHLNLFGWSYLEPCMAIEKELQQTASLYF